MINLVQNSEIDLDVLEGDASFTCEQQLILRNPLNRLQQVVLQSQVGTPRTFLLLGKKTQTKQLLQKTVYPIARYVL